MKQQVILISAVLVVLCHASQNTKPLFKRDAPNHRVERLRLVKRGAPNIRDIASLRTPIIPTDYSNLTPSPSQGGSDCEVEIREEVINRKKGKCVRLGDGSVPFCRVGLFTYYDDSC